MASQTMLAGMKFSINGTPNSHGSEMLDQLQLCTFVRHTASKHRATLGFLQFLPSPKNLLSLFSYEEKSLNGVNMGCALAIYFQVCPLYVPT